MLVVLARAVSVRGHVGLARAVCVRVYFSGVWVSGVCFFSGVCFSDVCFSGV